MTNRLWSGCLVALLCCTGPAKPGLADQGSDERTVQRKEFLATSLKVRHGLGRLRIEPGNGPKVQLEIEGPKGGVTAIQAQQRGGVLTVEGVSAAAVQGSIVQIGSGNSSIVIGGQSADVRVTQGDSVTVVRNAMADVRTTITVPVGMAVSLERVTGSVVVGDIQGSLNAVLDTGDLAVGRVKDAKLRILGSGDIQVAEVNGNLEAICQGSGDVVVERGTIDQLEVRIEGSGDVSIGGRARHAKLSVSGAGDIQVAEVVSKPTTRVEGAGDIRVGNW